jgi:hypothetical protein
MPVEVRMKTRIKLLSLLSLLTACIASPAFATGPFDGVWRLNTAKSHLAGDTRTYEDAGGGALKYTDSDETYTFRPDGNTFTTPLGVERSVKKNADGTYTTTNQRNGTRLYTSTWKLSDDGKKLTIERKGTKPNGDSFDNVSIYERTGPGEGILGGWKSISVKLSSPNTLTIQSDGDAVTLTIAAIKASSQAKWDGKDYPASGPTVPDGLTLALTKTGADSFKLVQKFKTKVLLTIRYHVSADGKTLTARGVNGQGKEPFSEVWEKQS